MEFSHVKRCTVVHDSYGDYLFAINMDIYHELSESPTIGDYIESFTFIFNICIQFLGNGHLRWYELLTESDSA